MNTKHWTLLKSKLQGATIALRMNNKSTKRYKFNRFYFLNQFKAWKKKRSESQIMIVHHRILRFKDLRISHKILFLAMVLILSTLFVMINDNVLIHTISNEDIQLIKENEQLAQQIQQMNYAFVVFLQEDDTNLDFYTNGTSPHIEAFDHAYTQALKSLKNIRNSSSYQTIKSDEIESSMNLVEINTLAMQEKFQKIIALNKERGFMSIGKISELNASMNVLEAELTQYESKEFLHYLLSQRKYEADYLVNLDRKVMTKLIINAGDALTIAKELSLDNTALTSIETYVENYKTIAKELQDLNLSIDQVKTETLALNQSVLLDISNLQNTIDNQIHHKIQSQIHHLLLLTGLVIMVAILLSYFIARVISRPIKDLNTRLQDISEGDGDLTARLHTNTKDELGIMARLFNSFVNRISEIIIHVQSNALQLHDSSSEIDHAMVQAEESIHEIAQKVQLIVDGLQSNAVVIEKTSAGVIELSGSAQHISAESQVAAEETEHILKASNTGSDKLDEVLLKINEIKTFATDLNTTLEQLNASTKQIYSIVDIINNIADQTGLLSLNAAIEAARAGEHGRGFSVVAAEVKKLADESKKSANDIGQIIQGITFEIRSASQMMNNEMVIVDEAVHRAQDTKFEFDDILSLINAINQKVQNISTASIHQSEVSEQMSQSIDELKNHAQEAAYSSEVISSNIETQASTISQISGKVHQLRSLSDALHEMTAKFIV